MRPDRPSCLSPWEPEMGQVHVHGGLSCRRPEAGVCSSAAGDPESWPLEPPGPPCRRAEDASPASGPGTSKTLCAHHISPQALPVTGKKAVVSSLNCTPRFLIALWLGCTYKSELIYGRVRVCVCVHASECACLCAAPWVAGYACVSECVL